MRKTYEFEAIIQKLDGMNAANIEFPNFIETEFGTKGQVKVKVCFKDYEYRGSLANMGLEYHCIGVVQQVRQAIGKQPSDRIKGRMYRDTEPRGRFT
ncbi:DUF1905 domain-containing protein [Lederbergia lenta]|uniref:DUF1905 domain-containing protein n=1 Tax=Lederbergia lenta TaxID=1467 RepID=UPI00203E7D98|nr:DUF1905 domain-containing protein [Lederbergia lenta]MCM3112736.1 DUF1905 domain-containing protein [Lederbergia lenta]